MAGAEKAACCKDGKAMVGADKADCCKDKAVKTTKAAVTKKTAKKTTLAKK